MSFLTQELTSDDIDNFFSINKSQSEQTFQKKGNVVASALQGHIFDPATGGAYQPDRSKTHDSKLPKYRRSTYEPTRQKYVEEYRQQEHEELMSMAASSISGRLSPESVVSHLESLELGSTVAGGSVAMAEMIPEGALGVYSNYSFKHKYMQLPVLEARDRIVQTVESNQVTIIQGPTGSGKTTQVPQFILDHYAEESRYCNIVVTQPRKIAAMSIARRVCEERDWALGTVCGFQIGLDRQASEDTRLLYCTTGVLKEKLIRKQNMREFTHVILDEVHERDIESDFALLIVKKLLRQNSPGVKVILMSATFDTGAFARYFALPVGNQLAQAPVISVGTMHHRVLEFFTEDLESKLGQAPAVDENQPEISPGMYDMAVGLVREFDLLEEKEQGKDKETGIAPIRGSVLIFLPGIREIKMMQEKLGQLKETSFLIPIPLHSTITLDEQNKVFRKPTKGYRKVILATNIAESSITVPDIKYVIDFCLTRNLFCDPETNFTQLQLEWASKANCTQRKGRAGRVSNGRVYYMVPSWFYRDKLPDYGTPEMQRSPLESLILKTKIFNMGEPKAILALALSPPNLEDIERTVLSLKEVGALSSTIGEANNPYDGELTFVGQVLAGLPVDVKIGKLLMLGHVFGVLEECLIIGAGLSLKSIFAQPLQSRLEAFKNKYSWADSSMSDCITMLNAYKTWESRTKNMEFQRAGATEKEWGTRNFLQIKALKEVAKLVEELRKRLESHNIKVPSHKPSFKQDHKDPTERLILKMVICGAFYPNYALKEETDEKEAVKILSNHDPLRTVVVKGLPMNEGILYHKQIRDLFSCCYMNPLPTISTEESRAYVEFAWKPGSAMQGRVHPGVPAAIKIRQIGIRLAVDQLDREEARRKLEELQKTTQNQRGSTELRSNRLRAETDGIEQDHSLSTVNIDPQITALRVKVTEVIECGHFWAMFDEAQTDALLVNIHAQLNNGPPLKPVDFVVHKGMLVAAPFVDVEEQYYRARVDNIVTERVQVSGVFKSILNMQVFFVDYGNTEMVHVDRLRILPPGLDKLPFLATEFYLCSIKPSSIRCPDGVWGKQANTLFKRQVFNKVLMAQVYSVVNNTVRAELVERLPTGQEINFNNELVQSQFAEVAEEPFLSQQNHEWRELQKRGDHGQFLQDNRLQVSIPSQSGDSGRHGGRRKGKKIYLSGPMNPLEMTFCSVTFSGRQRVVRVDPESVNCCAVDDSPENKFSRLMVASYIGLNAAGNSMIARDTTIMPQIAGLPALATLLFAPFAEFRTDPSGQCYTGALCGLGYDEEDVAVLPDHDIELAFETNFDQEDIVMINRVRMGINFALGSEGTVAGWSLDVFVNLQEKSRNELLNLLKKRREPMEPQVCHKLYEWNQVPPSSILSHSLSGTEADCPSLLPLHNGIILEEPVPMPQRSKAYLIQHLKDLQIKAESRWRSPVECELCKVTLDSATLPIHLHTSRHLRRVENLTGSL